MKSILLLFSLFTFSLSYSQDWEFLFETEDRAYFYKPNTDETAWIKVVSEKTQYYPSKTSTQQKTIDGYTMTLWKFSCRSKKIGIIKAITYSTDGKVVDSFTQNEVLVEMDYVNPDSIGEKILETFCK